MNRLKDDKAIWVWKLTMAQQWAHKAQQKQKELSRTLPEEY